MQLIFLPLDNPHYILGSVCLVFGIFYNTPKNIVKNVQYRCWAMATF